MSANRFQALDLSDDEEVTKKTVPKKTAAPKAEGAPKKAAPKAEGAKKSAPKTTNDTPAVNTEGEVTKINQRGGKGRGKDNRVGAKHQGENDKKRAPKHAMDRRSSTGRGRELAKDGRGRFGAGNVEQEAKDAEKNVAAATETADIVEVAVEPVEPEVPVVSFEDFMAEREAARQASALFGQAAAKRTVDAQQFSGLKNAATDLDSFIVGKLDQKTVADKKAKKTKKTLDINFSFAAPAEEPVVERKSKGPSKQKIDLAAFPAL